MSPTPIRTSNMSQSRCPYCGGAVAITATRCPQCNTVLSPDDGIVEERTATRLEPAPVVARGLPVNRQRTPTEKERLPAPVSKTETLSFRPRTRPPMAIVCLFDDGRETGEEIRVRVAHLLLGRSEGDVLIPHDGSISTRHAELFRTDDAGPHRWFLKDLGSTNGTFARVDEAILRHNQELLLGMTRFRFEAAPAGMVVDSQSPGAVQRASTSAWSVVAPNARQQDCPSLVQLTPAGDGQRIELSADDQVVGSGNVSGHIVLPDDPYISPRHARLYRDKRGRWLISKQEAENGVWLRIKQVEIESSGVFQIGEQRFSVRIP